MLLDQASNKLLYYLRFTWSYSHLNNHKLWSLGDRSFLLSRRSLGKSLEDDRWDKIICPIIM